MAAGSHEDMEDLLYEVVVNDDEQYSIWRADRELPLGWRRAAMSGTSSECLRYIEEVWTDMRPRAVRNT
jgi:MbtH protein